MIVSGGTASIKSSTADKSCAWPGVSFKAAGRPLDIGQRVYFRRQSAEKLPKPSSPFNLSHFLPGGPKAIRPGGLVGRAPAAVIVLDMKR